MYVAVFYTNVAKVDRDVAYVTMIVHVCYKLLMYVAPDVQTGS
jgi:hypothetical protein